MVETKAGHDHRRHLLRKTRALSACGFFTKKACGSSPPRETVNGVLGDPLSPFSPFSKRWGRFERLKRQNKSRAKFTGPRRGKKKDQKNVTIQQTIFFSQHTKARSQKINFRRALGHRALLGHPILSTTSESTLESLESESSESSFRHTMLRKDKL